MTSRALKRTVLAASIAVGLVTVAPPVRAQPNCPPAPTTNPSAAELEDARKKFQDAYKDEQDGKFEEALRKFQDVAKVKESASVRYRIAKNQANLGRLREARDNMRALAATKDCLPPKDRNIADSAAAEVVDLEKKIPKLAVKVQDKAPNDTRVSVDGTPVPSTGTPKPIELDPGDHTVSANGSGMKAFQKNVHLNPSSNETVTVQFEPEGGVVTPPGGGGEQPVVPPPPSRGALPYILVIGGGALVIIGGSMLLAREGTIDDINKTCPNGVCPTATRIDIEDKRDSAETMLPVGLAVLGVGAVATGLGVYLFVRPLKQPDAAPANGTQPASPRGQSFHFGPKAVRGGMMLGVGATF